MFAARILLAGLIALAPLGGGAAIARPIAFGPAAPAASALIIPLASEAELASRAPSLDAATRSALGAALRAAAFTFERGATLGVRGQAASPLILIVGTGPTPLNEEQALALGGKAAAETAAIDGPVALLASGLPPAVAERMAIGADLRSYRFDRHQTPKPRKPGEDAPLVVVGADAGAAQRFAAAGRPLVEAVDFARDLVNEPANILHPEEFVARTRKAFAGIPDVTIEVLDVPAMKRLGMGSILSVGQGSARPSRMLIVRYRGSGAAPLAIAGKGITFDSGGISLKPGEGMWRMKGDMAGAAAAVGAVLSLAKSRAPVSVIGIAALAENMPSGTATRPGDIVRAMNGKTIEIHNTDAEGRLVLADAVAYAERALQPAAIVTIATLTGSKVTALGDEYAGLFSRNDALAQQLDSAGRATGELTWRLPLHRNVAKDMASDVADIRNVVEGGGPGASLGAHFITFFADRVPLAHLDVAGSTLSASASDLAPIGANGFGVRLLDRFARDFRPVAEAPSTAQGQ